MAAKKTNTPARDLPPDVTAADLTYARTFPQAEAEQEAYWTRMREFRTALGDTPETLTLYRTEAFGWCVMTLGISRGKAGRADRSYGVTLDGKVVRLGNGPHVKATATLYLTPDNLERLQRYVNLYGQGLAAAGTIRDRISTRRARGQQMRAEGRTHWSW